MIEAAGVVHHERGVGEVRDVPVLAESDGEVLGPAVVVEVARDLPVLEEGADGVEEAPLVTVGVDVLLLGGDEKLGGDHPGPGHVGVVEVDLVPDDDLAVDNLELIHVPIVEGRVAVVVVRGDPSVVVPEGRVVGDGAPARGDAHGVVVEGRHRLLVDEARLVPGAGEGEVPGVDGVLDRPVVLLGLVRGGLRNLLVPFEMDLVVGDPRVDVPVGIRVGRDDLDEEDVVPPFEDEGGDGGVRVEVQGLGRG